MNVDYVARRTRVIVAERACLGRTDLTLDRAWNQAEERYDFLSVPIDHCHLITVLDTELQPGRDRGRVIYSYRQRPKIPAHLFE